MYLTTIYASFSVESSHNSGVRQFMANQLVKEDKHEKSVIFSKYRVKYI